MFSEICCPYETKIESYAQYKPKFDNQKQFFIFGYFLASLAILAVFTILAVAGAPPFKTALSTPVTSNFSGFEHSNPFSVCVLP